jgi:hypothetical protein
MMSHDDRVALLERRTQELSDRLERLEGRGDVPHLPPAARAAERTASRRTLHPAPGGTGADGATARVPGPQAPAPTPAPPRPAPRAWDLSALEGVVGGRLIAWLGGIAVVLGLALLAGVAISHGWLGPAARTLSAAGVAVGLLLAGLHLDRAASGAAAVDPAPADADARVSRRRLSSVVVAAGIGAGFVATCLAGPVHHLVPAALAAVLAMGVGALGVALAVRRQARAIAALGILGGLAAPLMTMATLSAAGAALALVAAASAAAVLVWQRWDWLRLGLVLLALPQVVAYACAADPPLPAALGALAVLALVLAVGSIGFELRAGAARPRVVSALLLLTGAAAIAGAGWTAAVGAGHHTIGQLWLVGAALVHLGAGVAVLTAGRRRVHADVALLLLAIGWVLADLAAATILHGLVLGLLWAASAALAAGLARRAGADHERVLALTGLTGQLVLALGGALVTIPPGRVLDGGSVESAVLLGAVVVAAAVAARLVPADRLRFPLNAIPGVLDVVALGTLAYLTLSLAHGTALVVALAAQAAALAAVARHQGASSGAGPLRPARAGALAFLGGAAVAALAGAAPPDGFVNGFPDPAGAALALAALVAATVAVARHDAGRARRRVLLAGAALAVLDLGSGLLVGAVPGHQAGQVAVSVLWAAGGLAALTLGLRFGRQVPRVAGLALLLVAAGNVFLLDLATLTSLPRVASLVAIGLLLLVAAAAWQRLADRPQPIR